MSETLTYLGYRFEVERVVEEDGCVFTVFRELDPDTPVEVIELLYRTANQNIACYLKRFASVPSPSAPTTP